MSGRRHVFGILWVMVLMLGASVLTGCGDTAVSPDPIDPKPTVPQVGGNWRGTWTSGRGRPVQATLSLNQQGSQLRGTLTVGRNVNDVSGTVSEFGVVRLQGQDVTGSCNSYFTEGNHLGLSNTNSRLDGPLRHNEALNCGGRVLSRGGRLELEKVL